MKATWISGIVLGLVTKPMLTNDRTSTPETAIRSHGGSATRPIRSSIVFGSRELKVVHSHSQTLLFCLSSAIHSRCYR